MTVTSAPGRGFRVVVILAVTCIVGLSLRWVWLERSVSNLRRAVSEFEIPGYRLDDGEVSGERNSLICFMCDPHVASRTVPINPSVTCSELEEALRVWSGAAVVGDAFEVLGVECAFIIHSFRGNRDTDVGGSIRERNGERVVRVFASDT